MWLNDDDTNTRLACTHHVQPLPTALPPFSEDQRGSVSAAYEAHGGLCSDFLLKMAELGTSSLPWGWALPGTGLGMSWLLGLWSQNWAPVVMCGALWWHLLSLCGPIPVLWERHKEPATKWRVLLPGLLLHLLLPHLAKVPNPNSHCMMKSDPLALRPMLYLFSIAACIETPTPDISGDGSEVGCSCCCLVCMNRYKEW